MPFSLSEHVDLDRSGYLDKIRRGQSTRAARELLEGWQRKELLGIVEETFRDSRIFDMQGLQAWLAGPHVNLREGASSSAIVLAVDAAAPLPQGPLKKLMLQVKCSILF